LSESPPVAADLQFRTARRESIPEIAIEKAALESYACWRPLARRSSCQKLPHRKTNFENRAPAR
jgi:hypothetical protein